MTRAPKILIVEDEMLVADVLEEMLKDIGCDVGGVAHTLKEAMEFAANQEFDAAVVDLLLKGESSWPVAEALMEKGIPFALSTGWPADALGPEWADCAKLAKPYQEADVKALISHLLPTRDCDLD